MCSICGEFPESVEHCLLLCNWTTAVWFGSNLHYLPDKGRISTLDDWLLEIHKKSSWLGLEELFPQVCFHLWEIWKHRCEVVIKGSVPNPLLVLENIKRGLSFWYEALASRRSLELDLQSQLNEELWHPPPCNVSKINIDGAWNKTNLKSGIGVVVRNHRGVSIAGLSWSGSHNSALEVEADAAVKALQLAAHHHLHDIILESDCLEVINALNSYPLVANWKISPMIERFMHLKPLFRGIKWHWVNRKANRVADAAAKLAKARLCSVDWASQPPISLLHVLRNDGLTGPP